PPVVIVPVHPVERTAEVTEAVIANVFERGGVPDFDTAHPWLYGPSGMSAVQLTIDHHAGVHVAERPILRIFPLGDQLAGGFLVLADSAVRDGVKMRVGGGRALTGLWAFELPHRLGTA